MAITATLLTRGSVSAGNTSATSASITPGANRLILVAVQNNSFGTPGTISLSGNSLTYVEEETLTYSGGAIRLSVFRAMGASPSAGAISITNLSNNGAQWAVIEFDGVDTSGTNGSGAIVQSVSNSTTGGSPNSLTVTLAALGDAVNNAVFAAFGCDSDALQTVGSGYTELSDDDTLTASESIGLMTQWKVPGTTTPDASGQPDFADVAGIGIEIKAASGGGVTSATFDMDASASVTWNGQTTASAALDSDASASVTWNGASRADSAFTVTAQAAVTWNGAATAGAALSALPVASVTWNGAAVSSAALNSSATAAVTWIGEAIAAGSGEFSMSATATVTFIGAATSQGAFDMDAAASLTMNGEDANEATENTDWRWAAALAEKERRKQRKKQIEANAMRAVQVAFPHVLAEYLSRRRTH